MISQRFYFGFWMFFTAVSSFSAEYFSLPAYILDDEINKTAQTWGCDPDKEFVDNWINQQNQHLKYKFQRQDVLELPYYCPTANVFSTADHDVFQVNKPALQYSANPMISLQIPYKKGRDPYSRPNQLKQKAKTTWDYCSNCQCEKESAIWKTLSKGEMEIKLCNACRLRFSKNKYCQGCMYVYYDRDVDDLHWIKCRSCVKRMHLKCRRESENNAEYLCDICRREET